MFRNRLLASVLAGSALFALACGDDDPFDPGPVGVLLEANMDRAQEVDGCPGSTTANGLARVTINVSNTVVSLIHLGFVNTSTPVHSGHIHFGEPGVAGPIIFDFGPNPVSGIERHFRASNYPNPVPAGAPANFAAFVEAMKNGQSYVNLHTESCPNGEIRGQLIADTEG